MPRARRPARLWLRPAGNGRAAVWIILDGGRQNSTGCGPDEGGKAEAALRAYIGAKHEPAAKGCRRTTETPVSDVLSVYLDEVVPELTSPAKVAARIGRLIDWWGSKKLSEVTPTSCRAYVEYRATAPIVQRGRGRRDGTHTEVTVTPQKPRSGGGAKRDLEDLRAAIEHHAERELHTGTVRVTLPEKGKPRPKYLTQGEIVRLLRVCWYHKREVIPPRGPRKGQRVSSAGYHDMRHLARFILMGIYTGSRSAPLLRASIHPQDGCAWLDLNAGLYYRLPEDEVEASNKKKPVSRIAPALMRHLIRWRDNNVMRSFPVEWGVDRRPVPRPEGLSDGEYDSMDLRQPVASVKTAWARAVKLAGIEGNPTPHTLRHTAVTWMKQRGFSSFEVGQFVGMSERMVDEVYGHHDPDFQSEVARGVGRAGKRRG